MKILKEKSREYNGKPYYKYKVNIPEKELKKANIKEGDELYVSESNSKKGEILLRKKAKTLK
ncbi:MAG: hypothetical protein ACOCUU_03140 [Nanoarchaeota archaeon]